jgi:hypothetical protein
MTTPPGPALEEYAKQHGLSYSAVCERRKRGNIKTVEGYETITVKRRIKRIYVVG